MQLSALTENLAAIRSELKSNHEKLASIDQIKAEKTGLISFLFFFLSIYRLYIRYRITFSCQSRRTSSFIRTIINH